MNTLGNRRGFTLLEIVVVLAVLAILAGAMVPHTVRQIRAERRAETEAEMNAIATALLAYYRDCRALPADEIGLRALVRSDGAPAGWDGPYLGGSGDAEADATTDAWGSDYRYARQAEIRGAAHPAAFLLISPGDDRQLDSRLDAGRWRLDRDADLVVQGVTQAIDQEWGAATRQRLELLSVAFDDYFTDVGGFPPGNDSTAVAALFASGAAGWRGPYLAGAAADWVRDDWGRALLVRPCSQVDGTPLSGRILLSLGPGAPDARINGERWRTGENDIFAVVSAARLQALRDRERYEEARRALRLAAAEVYVTHPAAAPGDYELVRSDPWGHAYRFAQATPLSGIVYSAGADGEDDAGADDDVYESLLWMQPETPGGEGGDE